MLEDENGRIVLKEASRHHTDGKTWIPCPQSQSTEKGITCSCGAEAYEKRRIALLEKIRKQLKK